MILYGNRSISKEVTSQKTQTSKVKEKNGSKIVDRLLIYLIILLGLNSFGSPL